MLDNVRHLTVTERAEIIARAKSDPTLSSAKLAKDYGLSARRVQRLLKEAGLGRKHGGSRGGIWATGEEGAGQKGFGGGRGPGEKRLEATPETVWVDALARIYFMGIDDAQYEEMRSRYAALPSVSRRMKPEARLDEIYAAIDLYYPHLKGRKVEGHDMGDHVIAMANSSIKAILDELPIDDPAKRLDVMAAIEQQAAEGGMAPGTRRLPRLVTEEMGEGELPRGVPFPTPAALAEAEAAMERAIETVAPTTEVLEGIPQEQRKDFLKEWAREQRERAHGVKHIDPATYLKLVELEQSIQALREQKRQEEVGLAARRMGGRLPPGRNPASPKVEDAMATALAALLVSRTYTPPQSRLGPPIPRRGRKRGKATRQDRRATFRRLMRI